MTGTTASAVNHNQNTSFHSQEKLHAQISKIIFKDMQI